VESGLTTHQLSEELDQQRGSRQGFVSHHRATLRCRPQCAGAAPERHVIQLDLNPEFQTNLFALNKPEAWAVLKTLRLLQAMTWV
jgi:hypothetical protein